MKEQFVRSAAVLGAEAIEKLNRATFAVVGLGGVGGICAETLARAGVGRLVLIDFDFIQTSNINRQVFALHSTVGQLKTEVAQNRLLDINPDLDLSPYPLKLSEDTIKTIPFAQCDYILDCIDDVPAKLFLALESQRLNIPIISCMGTGKKTNPALLEFADLFETKNCPLSRAVRQKAKKLGIKELQVVYSPETPKGVCVQGDERPSPGSLPYVPPMAGIMMAAKSIDHFLSLQAE